MQKGIKMDGNKSSRIKMSFRVKVLFILLFMIIFPVFLNTPLNSIFIKEKDDKADFPDQDLEIKVSSANPPKAFYFNFCKNITVDSTKVSGSGSHVNFPLLISVSDPDLRYKVQPDGDDIAFAIDNSWLDHEIELFNQEYNATHAYLIVWVRIPSLSTSVNTIVTMYYGNSTMSSQENPTFVWNNDYEAVWHMSDDPSGTVYDSTSNNNDGTAYGGMGASNQVSSKVGGGLFLDGTNDYILIPHSSSIDITGYQLTLEGWINLALVPTLYDAPVMVKAPSDNNERYMLGVDGGVNPSRINVRTTTSLSGYRRYDTGMLYQGTWTYISLVYDGTLGIGNQLFTYKNGVLVSSNWAEGTISSTTGNLHIGKRISTSRWLHGIIDELRISSIARSVDWLLTEYDNMNDPNTFYSVGSEQTISILPPNADYFNYYKIISIDHTQVSGTGSHINFPVLISLNDTDLRYDVQPDGDDIAFSANGKWLDHEIELFDQTYNSTHAIVLAWVRVPFLSTVIDTNISMYYSNSTMGSRENPSSVWDSGYVGVWHLNEEPNGTIYDSTSPSSDGSSSGSMSSSDLVPGMIGKALDFDGVDDYVYFINTPELQITGAMTVQAWFKANDIGNDYLFNKMGAVYRGWDLSFNPIDANFARVEFRYSSDGTTIYNPGSVLVRIGEWCHVVGVFKPNEFHKLFVNGTLVKMGTTLIPSSQYDPPYNPRIAEKAQGTTENYRV